MFATLGLSPAESLGPNPCDPSPKVTDIHPDQIYIPLLYNIWSVASYQFVLKSLTNSYNWDPAPLSEKVMACHSSTLAWKVPWTEEPGTVYGVAKSRTQLSD